ncbi:DUF1559 family PulG-like putative transporter [Blastopirellula sediminis]|nr:DUF1559 domain-containing protein [Blastopirellula sediminis]
MPRDAARIFSTSNALQGIGLAMHDYHDVYGSFPPAFVADANGKPLHSWRVLLLPFLDERELYEKYDFSQPWDAPDNRKLLDKMPWVFRDPRFRSDDPSLTTYQVVVGDGMIFDPQFGRVAFPDIRDGSTATLLAVENLGHAVPWTKPVDMSVSDLESGVLLDSAPRGMFVILMADGTRQNVYSKTAAQLKSAATRSGGETPPNWRL